MSSTTIVQASHDVPAPARGTQDEHIARTRHSVIVARRFFRQPSAVVGTVILLALIVVAVVGPRVSKWSSGDPDFLALTAPPSSEHWFGTDPGGADIFVAVCHGLGRSLLIGVISSVLMTIIAALAGTAIAYFEGWFETVGMWLLDMLLVIPSFLLIAMLVRTASGTTGWIWLTIGLTAFGWIGYARILRTLALSLRERDFVRAAKYMGVRPIRIIVRHLVPNLGSVLVINTVLGVVGAVNSETALSYLGLGIQPPDVSLGTILQTGSGTILTAPWILIAPSVFLVLLTFSMQLIGDGLRDALDPSSRAGGKP